LFAVGGELRLERAQGARGEGGRVGPEQRRRVHGRTHLDDGLIGEVSALAGAALGVGDVRVLWLRIFGRAVGPVVRRIQARVVPDVAEVGRATAAIRGAAARGAVRP